MENQQTELGCKEPTFTENYISEKKRQREELSYIFGRLKRVHHTLVGDSNPAEENLKGGVEKEKSLAADLDSDVLCTAHLLSSIKETLSGIEAFI